VTQLRKQPVKETLFAFGLAAAAVIAIATAWGWDNFIDAWTRPEWIWLAVAFGAQLLALAAYVVAYHAVTQVHDGKALPLSLAVRVVMAGFGPFWVRGGFSIDKHTLETVHEDEHAATVRVLGLGALEWALLAPAAWLSAVVLLATDDPGVLKSLLWPWVIAVPIGFAIGLYISSPGRQEHYAHYRTGWRRHFAITMRGLGTLHALRDVGSWWGAWLGAAFYWSFDILCLYSSLRFIGPYLSLWETILAYATGYALTRRSTPLGGAGATEVLMTFALYWVGQPVASSLAAVVVYRAFNFVLPTLPALAACKSVGSFLEEFYERGREPARGYGGTGEPLAAGGGGG
jgi:uncharacterized membrane protein YbhN (UPF0104 family)